MKIEISPIPKNVPINTELIKKYIEQISNHKYFFIPLTTPYYDNPLELENIIKLITPNIKSN